MVASARQGQSARAVAAQRDLLIRRLFEQRNTLELGDESEAIKSLAGLAKLSGKHVRRIVFGEAPTPAPKALSRTDLAGLARRHRGQSEAMAFLNATGV